MFVIGQHSGPLPDFPQLSRDHQREQARAWRTANAICRADGARVRPDVHRRYTEPQPRAEGPKTETGNVYILSCFNLGYILLLIIHHHKTKVRLK